MELVASGRSKVVVDTSCWEVMPKTARTSVGGDCTMIALVQEEVADVCLHEPALVPVSDENIELVIPVGEEVAGVLL